MKKNAIIVLATNNYLPIGLRLISKIHKHYKNIDNLDIHLVTDRDVSDKVKYDNVIFHNRVAKDWTLSTVLKLDVCKYVCENYDYNYIGCLDADTNIHKDFSEDEIFAESFVMKHASTGITPPREHYESNPKSSAYVDPSEYREIYYQTCYFGGNKQIMLDMVNLAIELRDIDFNNNIVAKWTDESYLQKYFIKNPPLKEFEPLNQDLFPLTIDDKGSTQVKFFTGKYKKPFEELSTQEYEDVLESIYQLLYKKDYNWDIFDNKVILSNQN